MIQGTIQITGLLAPSSSADTYPITDAIYGKDGLRNVNSLTDLTGTTGITTDRRRAGMLVGVSGNTSATTTSYYMLKPEPWDYTISDWVLTNIGTGTTNNTTITPQYWTSGTSIGSITTLSGNNTSSGAYALSTGSGTTASGSCSFSEGQVTSSINVATHSEGYYTTSSGMFGSHSEGYYTTASGMYGSHSEGKYTTASGASSHSGGVGVSGNTILAGGSASFNHSENTSGGIAGRGALADNSAILGGKNHNINTGSNNSVILGGSGNTVNSNVLNSVVLGGIGLTATSANTVYVPTLNVNSVTNDNTIESLLVVDSFGYVRYKQLNTVYTSSTITNGQSVVLQLNSDITKLSFDPTYSTPTLVTPVYSAILPTSGERRLILENKSSATTVTVTLPQTQYTSGGTRTYYQTLNTMSLMTGATVEIHYSFFPDSIRVIMQEFFYKY